MAQDKDLEDLEAFFRRLESDPESIDAETLIGAFRAIRRWMLVSSMRLQVLEERMAELEAAMEALQRRHEESEALLRQILTHNLWWDLARGAMPLFSPN